MNGQLIFICFEINLFISLLEEKPHGQTIVNIRVDIWMTRNMDLVSFSGHLIVGMKDTG